MASWVTLQIELDGQVYESPKSERIFSLLHHHKLSYYLQGTDSFQLTNGKYLIRVRVPPQIADNVEPELNNTTGVIVIRVHQPYKKKRKR